MTTYNQAQADAIFTTNQNIIVSASAGTGKTYTLVQRLLNLCTRDENPISLDRIVALTFTDAAASEMKKRLSKVLKEKADTASLEKKAHIQQQLLYLNTAKISTIHSFCLDIIKKYYYVINLDPAMINNTLSDGEILSLKEKAFEETLLSYQDASELLKYFDKTLYNPEALKRITFDTLHSIDTILVEEQLTRIQQLSDLKEPLYSLFMSGAMYAFEAIQQQVEKLCDFSTFQDDAIRELLLLVQEQFNHISAESYTLIRQGLQHFYDADPINNINARKLKEMDSIKKESLLALKKEIKTSIQKFLDTYIDDELLVQHHNDSLVQLRLFFTFVRMVKEKYNQFKRNEKGITFDDMEHLAYDILTKDNGRIAKVYQSEIDEILVDEFQDTSTTQNDIIELISKGNNIFRVGDIKQSIYRFRHAKPQIMQGLMKSDNQKVIYFQENYRSNQNIVDFTNSFFSTLMNNTLSQETYTAGDHVSAQPNKKTTGDIIFFDLEASKENSLDYSTSLTKALFIAKKIDEMVKTKNYRYRDFAILVKNHSVKKELIQAFQAYQIPYFSDAKTGVYQSFIGQIILSVFKLKIDSTDEIALTALLTSPLYDISDDILAAYVCEHKSILSALQQQQHPILEFVKSIQSLSLSDVLNTLNTQCDFILNKLDLQQKNNFNLIYEDVLQFEKKSMDTQAFLKRVEMLSREKTSEAISVGEDDDVVFIMTIHTSKGLQYKVVFLWGSLKATSADAYIISDNYIGIKATDPTLYTTTNTPTYLALAFEEKAESTKEFIRLLYVAVTRAEESLFVVEMKNTYTSKDVISCNSALSSMIRCHLTKQHQMRIETIALDENSFNILKPVESNDTPIQTYTTQQSKTITKHKPSNHESSHLQLNPYRFTRGLHIHEQLEQLSCKEDLLKLPKHLQESMAPFVHSDLFQTMAQMPLYHEYPFIYKKENTFTKGIIDLLAKNDKYAYIVDFKTDRNTTTALLKQMYTEQLKTYASVLQEAYPHLEIKAYLYSLDLKTLIEIV